MITSYLRQLECILCGKLLDPEELHTTCPDCSGSLFARYDLDSLRTDHGGNWVDETLPTLWRYARLLPVRRKRHRLSLGEGWTPLVQPEPMLARWKTNSLWIKDEGPNPTGSFKARGLSVAVSRALELGAKELAVPSAGNAAGALAAYAALARLPAFVAMPRTVSRLFSLECRAYGAQVLEVNGHIGDAGRKLTESRPGAFFMSTLKEPYRVEGKKTMGFELWEQMGSMPDVILYPTGGGTGLIGMPKAFDELELLGLTGPKRPRMVAVQTEGCAPVVKAFHDGRESIEAWPEPHTFASGLCVPRPYADREILRILRETDGSAVAVTEEEMVRATFEMGSEGAIFPAPEGAAVYAAYGRLRRSGWIDPDEVTVLFNTGSGLKYADTFPMHYLSQVRP